MVINLVWRYFTIINHKERVLRLIIVHFTVNNPRIHDY